MKITRRRRRGTRAPRQGRSYSGGAAKKIQALAYIPPDDIYGSFNRLMESLDEDTDNTLGDFQQYFETMWLGVVQQGRRKWPEFEVELRSVHERTVNDLPRTNKALDGWHNVFKKRMVITHPTESKLINKIRSEQASTEMVIEQIF